MKKNSPWSSFQYAVRGLRFVYKNERNFRIESFFLLVVLASFSFFPLSRIEIVALILVSGAVLILEIVNTVVEHFLDLIKPRLSYQVQVVKDILAGMVLVSVLIAVIIGSIIYIPAFIELTRSFMVQ